MEYDRLTIRTILRDLHERLADMSTLDLAFAYADYLDFDLDGDSYFIQEMQARGLTFEDLEQELITYYQTEDAPSL